MASKADRARARKARTIAAAERARAAPASAAVAKAPPARSQASSGAGARRAGRDDGLDMLLQRGRITRAQAEAGRHYGMLWRTSQIAGAAPIRVVDLLGSGGGAGAGIAEQEPGHAAWIADCRAQLAVAHAALNGHEEIIAVLDMICGAGMRPREITTDQRETEQIETALRLALDMLIRCFRAELARARGERAVA